MGEENPSGIEPTEFYVLVKPIRVEEKTAGGLIIPQTKLEKDEFGRTEGDLLAVSPLAFSYSDSWPDGTRPGIGRRVIFSKYSATEIEGDDGLPYWLMPDKAIVAVKTNG